MFVKSILIVFDMSEDRKSPLGFPAGATKEYTPDSPPSIKSPKKPDRSQQNIAKKARDKTITLNATNFALSR